jgi:hypothetical protein
VGEARLSGPEEVQIQTGLNPLKTTGSPGELSPHHGLWDSRARTKNFCHKQLVADSGHISQIDRVLATCFLVSQIALECSLSSEPHAHPHTKRVWGRYLQMSAAVFYLARFRTHWLEIGRRVRAPSGIATTTPAFRLEARHPGDVQHVIGVPSLGSVPIA